MPAGHGLRSRTRDSFSRPFRGKGFIPLSTYLRTYKLGDYVDIKVNSAVHKVRFWFCVRGKGAGYFLRAAGRRLPPPLFACCRLGRPAALPDTVRRSKCSTGGRLLAGVERAVADRYVRPLWRRDHTARRGAPF
jgi:hypothetical protein